MKRCTELSFSAQSPFDTSTPMNHDCIMTIISDRKEQQQNKRLSLFVFPLANLLVFISLLTCFYHNLMVMHACQKDQALPMLSKEAFINSSLKREALLSLSNLSSVDYYACCGLGHRLTKMSDAHYAASKLGFALRSFWGYCDSVEVYGFLFGPQPETELAHVHHRNHFVRINNEVEGMVKFHRNASAENCPCVQEKADSDLQFFRRHRERFRGRQMVEDYRTKNFNSNFTTIGIHIRAGNGEEGHFQNMGRDINDPERWLQRVVQLILSQSEWNRKPLQVFVATDTGDIIHELESLLEPHGISVLQVNQARPKKGEGVLFGQGGQVLKEGDKCLRSWESTLMDMILLSYADVVIAARPSSFTQSMPLSLIMAREKHAVSEPFCEVNADASDMRCYSSYSDWCCHGDTDFVLEETHQRNEYIRKPKRGYSAWNIYKNKIQERGAEGCFLRPAGSKQGCLPYNSKESLIQMS